MDTYLKDRSLFRGGGGGGGRDANLGGRVTIFWTQIWGGPLSFNLDLGAGYAFLSLYIFSKSQKIFKKPFLKDFCPLCKLVRLFFKLGAYWH